MVAERATRILYPPKVMDAIQVDPVVVPTRPRGRPRKYTDPAPGEEVSLAQRKAMYAREYAKAEYAANPQKVKERVRVTYAKRKALVELARDLIHRMQVVSNQ